MAETDHGPDWIVGDYRGNRHSEPNHTLEVGSQTYRITNLPGTASLLECEVAFRFTARPLNIPRAASRSNGYEQGRWSILFREGFNLSQSRLFVGLLALSLAAGCKAQTPPSQTASHNSSDSALNRSIEVMVRSQYNVPQDYIVTIGERKPSIIGGYDKLPITLGRGEKKTVVDFLISTDGKTLARLETFDLAANPALSIDVSGRPIRGNPAAKVTVINFDDLECPFCARLHQSLFPDALVRYKDKVRFIYKDNPLPADMHPWAMHAAVDANCLAAESGDVYWTYVDYLHTHGQEVTGPDRNLAKSFAALDRIARQQATLGKLDNVKLDTCLAKQDESPVRASLREAEALRIESAPAVFVDGERFDGAIPEEQLWQVIDRALRAAGVEPPPAPATTAPATPAGSGK
jgi:protein-disulfide isomerase